MYLNVISVRKALFLKQYKYGHCPEGGGEFNPCPNVFGALFYGALYLGKMTKRGGGVEGLAKRFGSILKVLYG